MNLVTGGNKIILLQFVFRIDIVFELIKYVVWASGEMVDALVLGTNGAIRGGSSPLSPTLRV